MPLINPYMLVPDEYIPADVAHHLFKYDGRNIDRPNQVLVNLADLDVERTRNAYEKLDGKYREESVDENIHSQNYQEVKIYELIGDDLSKRKRSLDNPKKEEMRKKRSHLKQLHPKGKRRLMLNEDNDSKLFDETPSLFGVESRPSAAEEDESAHQEPQTRSANSSESNSEPLTLGNLLKPDVNENSETNNGGLLSALTGNNGGDNNPGSSISETNASEGGENESVLPFLPSGNSKPEESKAEEASSSSTNKAPGNIPGFIPFIGSSNKNNSSSSNAEDTSEGSNGLNNYIPGGLSPSTATNMIPGSFNPFSGNSSSEESSSKPGQSGLGSKIPGLSGIKDQIPGLGGDESGSQNPTLLLGGFSVLVMPLSSSNMASALQGASQLSSMLPGGGVAGMVPGMG